MEKLLIKGGNSLHGTINCSGAKNAALPMIAATILCNEKITLKNLPYLQDANKVNFLELFFHCKE